MSLPFLFYFPEAFAFADKNLPRQVCSCALDVSPFPSPVFTLSPDSVFVERFSPYPFPLLTQPLLRETVPALAFAFSPL